MPMLIMLTTVNAHLIHNSNTAWVRSLSSYDKLYSPKRYSWVQQKQECLKTTDLYLYGTTADSRVFFELSCKHWKAGASTNGGLGDGSPTISKMGGLPREDYTESPFRA